MKTDIEIAREAKMLPISEIAKALGVERSLVAIGESCRYIATAIVNIFFGALIAKFGPKKLIIAGFCSLSLGALIYSLATNLWMIYIAGSLFGIGFSWTSTTMVGYLIGIWCSKNKGTIMGAVLASNGIGGAIAIQLVGGIINPEVVGSYRNGYKLIAAIIAVTGLILFIFLRDRPKDQTDMVKASTNKTKKKGCDWVGIEFSSAIKKPYFIGILICIFFSGMILQGSHGIVAMHLKDIGMDYGLVKTLLSVGSVIIVSAKFFTGFAYDRCGLRITATVITAIAAISPFMLALTNNTAAGIALAIVFIVISQYGMPLETIMLPIYAQDLFGQKSYAKILGIFVSVNTAGYAVGSPIMNLCYDIFGSYKPALILVGSIMLCVLVLQQFVIVSANKERERIISVLEQDTVKAGTNQAKS